MQCTWLVVLAAIAVGMANAANFNPRRALLDYLKEKSDYEVPPPPEALPVKVQVSLKLMRILDACPDKYCIKVQVLEMYNWTDPRLKWNPENYGGVDYFPIDIDYIWLPDVDIAGDKKGHSMRRRFADDKATVLSSGSVLLIAPQKYEILCNSTVWEESTGGGSSSSGNKKSSLSITSNRRSGSDPRQRQLQLRKTSGSGDEKQYTCEFYQTSWMYDTDIVEVLPATEEEEQGRKPSRPREMRIRDGGPRRGSSFGEEEEQQEEDNENESSQSEYPFSRQQQSRNTRSQRADRGGLNQQSTNRRSRRQESSSNGKNGKQMKKTTKKIPFSQWTSTACLELFEPNERFDVTDYSAYRELNSLPYAPERQWSMVYYRLAFVDKQPEDEDDDQKNSSKKSKKQQVNRQQQQTEDEEEEEEQEQRQREERQSRNSNNGAASKRDLKRRNGKRNGRKTAQIDTNAMVQEDESVEAW